MMLADYSSTNQQRLRSPGEGSRNDSRRLDIDSLHILHCCCHVMRNRLQVRCIAKGAVMLAYVGKLKLLHPKP